MNAAVLVQMREYVTLTIQSMQRSQNDWGRRLVAFSKRFSLNIYVLASTQWLAHSKQLPNSR
jgi:hypothetical protein